MNPNFGSKLFASYSSGYEQFDFKKNRKRVFVERVVNEKSPLKYRLDKSISTIQAIPLELRASTKKTIVWLLSNQYVPRIQNSQIVFEFKQGGSSKQEKGKHCSSPKFPPSVHEPKSEAEYAKMLEQAEKEKSYLKIVQELEKLAQLFFLEAKFALACKVFNAAITLNKVYSQDPSMTLFLHQSLAKVELTYAEKLSGKTPTQFSNTAEMDKIQSYRSRLAKSREILSRKLDENSSLDMQETLKAITEFRIELTIDLISDCFALLGFPPCKYAFVSMGSMSRNETSPFSDLEFAIIIDKDSPQNREYFRNLTRLLEVKIINLGETHYPILQHGLESPTPSGFCFDSGGNSPLGKEGLFELIGTPEELANYLTSRWFDIDLIMSNAMSNLNIIFGDEQLLSLYEAEAQEILDAQVAEKDFPLKERERRALALIQGDILEFAPQLDGHKEESKIFDIKKELYRLPNSILNGLAVFYNLKSKNSWDRIRELLQRGLLSPKGAENFAWAISEIARFRVKTHIHYGSENEKIFYKPQSDYQNYQWNSGNYYVLTEQDLEKISNIFRVLVPIYKAAIKFCETYGQVNLFQESQLIEEGFFAQAEALYSVRRLEEAKEAYKKGLALDPTNLLGLTMLGYIFLKLSLYDEAKEYYKKALEELERTRGDHEYNEQTVPTYILLLTSLAETLTEKSPQEALSYLQTAHQLHEKYIKKETSHLIKIYIGMSLPLITKGDLASAIYYLEEAQRIYEDLKDDADEYSIRQNSSEISSALNNLGYIYTQTSNYDSAIRCFHQAIELAGHNGGIRLVHLGVALAGAGREQEGIDKLKEALAIQEKIFGKVNPDVATTLSHLAHIYNKVKDYKTALLFSKQELYVNQSLYGVWDNTNIARWDNLGNIALSYEDFEQALICYQSELETAIQCKSEAIRISSIYAKISTAAWKKGYHKVSIKNAKKALRLYEESVGEEDQNYSTLLSNFAFTLQHTNPKQGIALLMRCLDLNKKLWGNNHPQVARCMEKLGNFYTQLENRKEALDWYKKAMQFI